MQDTELKFLNDPQMSGYQSGIVDRQLLEAIETPVDMRNPAVTRGFGFWERAGTSCMGFSKAMSNEQQYVLRNYTVEEMKGQTPAIQDNLRAINESFRGKTVYLKIHDTNGLELDPNVLHPFVRVYVIDIKTGCFLRKTNAGPAVNYYEHIGQLTSNKEYATGNAPFFVPFSTKPLDLRITGENDPHWNEEFLINDDAQVFLSPDTVLLFEILDFNFKLVKARSKALRSDNFYPVAWAFLRPAGSSKYHMGVNKLQLYRFKYKRPSWFSEMHRPEVFYDFNWFRKEFYPSFLRVELRVVDTPVPSMVKGLTSGPFEREEGLKSFYELEAEAEKPKNYKLGGKEELDAEALARAKRLTSWRRLYGEPCKPPTKLAFKLQTCALGCFRLAFSHNGKFLAAACTDQDTVIKIFQIEDGELAYKLRGHADLVHDLAWSANDFFLLSASSDGTAKLWDFTKEFSTGFEAAGYSTGAFNPGTADFLVASMQHPSYVYSARFHPDDKYDGQFIVATACYDTKVRIWMLHQNTAEAHVLAELSITPASELQYKNLRERVKKEQQTTAAERERTRLDQTRPRTFQDTFKGRSTFKDLGEVGMPEADEVYRYPNFLMFDMQGSVYVGDSVGTIHIWSVQIRAQQLETHKTGELEHEELQGDTINCMTLLPPEQREIMALSRDNVIRLLQMPRGSDKTLPIVYRRFFGAVVEKFSIRSCVSPDGQYIASGSEDGKVRMWDVASGFQVDMSDWELSLKDMVADVCWSESYNMVAVAGFGSEYSVLVYVYEKTQSEVETTLMNQEPINPKEVLAAQKDNKGALTHELQRRVLPSRP
jgi:jouberin